MLNSTTVDSLIIQVALVGHSSFLSHILIGRVAFQEGLHFIKRTGTFHYVYHSACMCSPCKIPLTSLKLTTVVLVTLQVDTTADDRSPRQLLCGELCQGGCSSGGQRKRFKDRLKVLEINLGSWGSLALDRPAWRAKRTSGARAAEIKRIAEAQRK